MGAKLTYLDFRDKVYDKDLHTHTYTQKIRAAFDNGRIYHGYMDRDPYYKLFWSNATLRDCCYDCQYATLKRYSDITIGDWWGDCSIAADFFADNAESSVLVNTSKGERLFNEIKSKAEILEVDANAIMQRNLKAPTPRGITYNMFWRDYHTHSFKYCLARYGDLYGLFRAYRKVRAHLKRK